MKMEDKKERKPLLCMYCQKPFDCRSTLDAHILSHTGVRPYRCLDCEESYKNGHQLKKHCEKYKHRGERYYTNALSIRKIKGKKTMICVHCGKTLPNLSGLMVHLRKHTGEKPFVCSECGQSFSTNFSLTDHFYKHSGAQKPHMCSECGRGFIQANQLKMHMRYHTKDKQFSCSKCDKQFYRRRSLKSHMLFVHSENRPFSCEGCDKTFPTAAYLRVHSICHSTDRPHVCPQCNKAFLRESSLRTHIMTHSKERPHACDKCAKTYTTKENLKHHSLIHSVTKTYICPKCGKIFNRASLLKNHIASHSNERPYLCDICGVGFKTKFTMKSHRMNHSGMKPHKCDQCGKRFNRASCLTVHIRHVHEYELNFVCEHCGKAFKSRGILKTHLSFHEERSHVCSFCSKAFHTINHLKRHMVKHTGQRPYRCLLCDRTFTQISPLFKHIRLDHPDKISDLSDPQKKQKLYTYTKLHALDTVDPKQPPAETGVNTKPPSAATGVNSKQPAAAISVNLKPSLNMETSQEVANPALCENRGKTKDKTTPRESTVQNDVVPPSNHVKKSLVEYTGENVTGFLKPVQKHSSVCTLRDPIEVPQHQANTHNHTENIASCQPLQIPTLENDVASSTLQPSFPMYVPNILETNYTFFQQYPLHSSSYQMPSSIPFSQKTGWNIHGEQNDALEHGNPPGSSYNIGSNTNLFDSMNLTYETGNNLHESGKLANVANQSVIHNDAINHSMGYMVQQDPPENEPKTESGEQVNIDVHQEEDDNASSDGTEIYSDVNDDEPLANYKRQHDIDEEDDEPLANLKSQHDIDDEDDKPLANWKSQRRRTQSSTDQSSSDSEMEEPKIYKEDSMTSDEEDDEPLAYLKRRHDIPHTGTQSGNVRSLRNRSLMLQKEKSKSLKNWHSEKGPPICKVCSKAFACYDTLKEHMASHTGRMLYYCELCERAFSSPTAVQYHTRLEHSKRKMPFPCALCDKRYFNKSLLKSHTLSHLGVKNHKCDICGKAFKEKHQVKDHMLTHTGVRPFMCDQCGASFMRESDVKTHVNSVHATERDFACTKCEKNFTSKGALHTHLKFHAKPSSVCSYCGKAFHTRSHLKRHMVAHTGQRPYQCSLCTHTFTQISPLYKHIRLDHPEQSIDSLSKESKKTLYSYTPYKD